MPRFVIPLAASSLMIGALAACAPDSGVSLGEVDDPPSSSPARTTVAAAADTSVTTSAATSAASTSTSASAAAAMDSVQLRLNSSYEVSPGVLQGRDLLFTDIEWMGVSDSAAYDGEKCAAVITVTDPGGQIVLTDRQSTCSGETSVTIRPGNTGTGTYTVTARLAPWEDAENPAESTFEFDVIAWGT